MREISARRQTVVLRAVAYDCKVETVTCQRDTSVLAGSGLVLRREEYKETQKMTLLKTGECKDGSQHDRAETRIKDRRRANHPQSPSPKQGLQSLVHLVHLFNNLDLTIPPTSIKA